MPHPNKPQLAFAWIGAPELLTPLWAAMTQTPFQGETPRELLHRPQIIAADTETWSYRFSRCDKLSEILYMRVNARRHSGLLWCKEARATLRPEEYKMLCYAGGCRMPIVIFLQHVNEATEEADKEEQGLRLFLDELGFQADEALFVYGAKPHESITHLYQRLSQELTATEELSLPPLMMRCQEADLLFFVEGEGGLTEDLREVYLKDGKHLLHATEHQISRQHQAAELSSLTLHVKFEAMVSLRPDLIFSGRLSYKKEREVYIQQSVVFV
jgi:hypothetical protein